MSKPLLGAKAPSSPNGRGADMAGSASPPTNCPKPSSGPRARRRPAVGPDPAATPRPDFVHAVRERANAPTRQGVNRSQLCQSHITLCKIRFTISPQASPLLPAPPSQDARRTPPPSSSPTAPRRTPCPPPWPPWRPPPNRRRRRTRRPGSPAIRPPAAVRRAPVWAAVEVEEGGAGGRDGVVNPCPQRLNMPFSPPAGAR